MSRRRRIDRGTANAVASSAHVGMMNNQDAFVQWLVDPHPMVTVRTDVHWRRVNSSQDLAYCGGGATKNDFFGCGGVPAKGRCELAYLANVTVQARPASFFTINACCARAFGWGVIGQDFTGSSADYGYLEGAISF